MIENENDIPQSERRRLSTTKILKYFSIVVLAFSVGYIHYYYVSQLFENATHFSHLSEMEREMLLRTEMGFYYSFYKTVVQERPFMAGITKLMYDRKVEYPNEVNAFNRFNIHPEVLIGALYSYFEPVLNTTTHKECRIIHRGEGLPPVESCIGLSQPIMFYIEAVWVLAGLKVAALFLQATALSSSILGGIVAVTQYFVNHSECTRVHTAPNERENMAASLLVLQLWCVTCQLRDKDRRATVSLQISIFILNCLCLLFWQFSQFIFLTQLAIFFVMEQIKVIDIRTFSILLHSHFCGLHTAVLLLQGNDMLKSSLYTSFFIVVSLYCLFFSSLRVKVEDRMDLIVESWLVLLRISIAVILSIYLKQIISIFLSVDEDSHIWDILYSKFTSYRSFHTLIYTCSEVFDFLPFKTVKQLMYSFLLPFVALSVLNVVNTWLRTATHAVKKEMSEMQHKDKGSDRDSTDEDSGIDTEKQTQGDLDCICNSLRSKMGKRDSLMTFLRNLTIEPAVFYNVSQMIVYGVMAALVMRLKLLFVPQMCVVAALIMNKHYYRLPQKYMRYIPFFWIVSLLPVLQKLMENVTEEMSYIGEFNDPAQERLLQWVSRTAADSVFAGSMPLSAAVLLATRRAVVTHPHYENRHARQRAYAVYKMYGRFTGEELYQELSKLRVTHLLVETSYCYGRSNKGCSFVDIWDAETGGSDRPALCHALLAAVDSGGLPDHLYPVYRDAHYAVFRLHDYSVRYMPRSFDT